jgi:hypothetical protein
MKLFLFTPRDSELRPLNDDPAEAVDWDSYLPPEARERMRREAKPVIKEDETNLRHVHPEAWAARVGRLRKKGS